MKIACIIKNEDLWSKFILQIDMPSSEFKNKFSAKVKCELGKVLRISASLEFSVTSHRKGVVDGIGGAAKSAVKRRVMSKGQNAAVEQNSDLRLCEGCER